MLQKVQNGVRSESLHTLTDSERNFFSDGKHFCAAAAHFDLFSVTVDSMNIVARSAVVCHAYLCVLGLLLPPLKTHGGWTNLR